MEKQKRNKDVHKRIDFTTEFMSQIDKRLKETSENFTVYVTRLIREDLKRDNS